MNAFLNLSFLFRWIPWLSSFVTVAPLMTPYLNGDVGILMRSMYVDIPDRIRKAQSDQRFGTVKGRRSVFTDIFASSLPEEEKTVERLSGEGFSLTGAGTETTAVSEIRAKLQSKGFVISTFTYGDVVDAVCHHLLSACASGCSGSTE